MARRRSHRHSKEVLLRQGEECVGSQIHTGRIRKRQDDKCWFCTRPARMSRSHVFLHCPNAGLAAARVEV